jgi:Holliday junction resolvase
MGKSQRAKGARGQREARAVLESHGYHVTQIACGIKSEDLLAEYDAVTWSVEVKWHKIADISAFEKQAREQAKRRSLPYLLLVRIPDRPHTFLALTDEDARVMCLREQVFDGTMGGA